MMSANHADDAIVTTLERFAEPVEQEPLAFGIALDKLAGNTYIFSALLTTLPFLQPIPLGFFALIGSAAFLSMGWQLFQGVEVFVLPTKIRQVTLGIKMRRRLVSTCLYILRITHRFSRPRLQCLIAGQAGQRIGGSILILVGVFVAIPLGGIVPFKNLFPSLAVIFYCAGKAKQDGVMVLLAILSLILTVVFYSAIAYVVWMFGTAALQHFIWD